MPYEMSRDFSHPVSFHVMLSVSVATPPGYGIYGIVEFNVPLDTVETGALSSDVHLSFSNGGPAT